MNQCVKNKSGKTFLYRLWKHIDKKKYVSLPVYKLHAYLSEKLKNKGVIIFSSNLKLKKYRWLDETQFNPKPILPSFIQKAAFDEIYKKFLCLQLRENTMETLALGSSHGLYGYRADDSRNEVNACIASQDLYGSYELYKKYAHAPRLKNVVLFYSVFSPGFITELTSEKGSSDLHRFFFGIPYRFSFDDEKRELFRNLALLVAEEREALKDYSYIGNCEYTFFIPPETDAESRVSAHVKHNRRNNNQNEYVKELIQAAGEKNHNLLIVIPPVRSDYAKLLPPFEELFPDLLRLKDDVRIVSFLNDGDFSDDDFGDTDHLNKTGAEKLTEKIRNHLS